MQVNEAVVLRDRGSNGLVETTIVNCGEIIAMREVRKASIWLERSGVLQRRIQNHRVWTGNRAWVYILRIRVRNRVIRWECHLPRIPTLLVLELAKWLLSRGEIRNTLSGPERGLSW